MAEAQALSTDQSQEYLAEVELVAGLASALGAQGDASTAQLGGQIGSSGFENNYLTHAQRETVEARLAEWVACRESGECSDAQKQEILSDRITTVIKPRNPTNYLNNLRSRQ